MKKSALVTLAALGSAVALGLTGCAANESSAPSKEGEPTKSALSGSLQGGGASSQGAAQEAWIAAFQTSNPDVTVNYDPAGSGNGRESFQQGAAAFAGSDRAFKAEEIKKGPFNTCQSSDIVELPAYISPIAIGFKLDGIDNLNLDATTVAKIFTGQVTKWNDPAIADQNPDVKLPDLDIKPVHRADKSGTTGNFTEYLAAAAPEVWTAGGVEEWPTELGGEAADKTSGVVAAINGGTGLIGYLDASKAKGLGTVSIKVGEEYVPYSAEAAAAIVDHSKIESGRSEHDLAVELDRTSQQAGVYPIVLVSYLIGCEQYKEAKDAELVKEYFKYIISEDGQKAAAEAAGSAPISSTLREKATKAIDSIN